jgi:DnaJ domain
VLLAELNVRHTRRHMPTRRVALGQRVLPTEHPGYGPLLLACVVATNIEGLDEEQAEAFTPFLREARQGLSIPRRALRFRLQTDTEGLALSRHRLLGESAGIVVELDIHGRYPVPQVLGTVMAASAMASYPRELAFRAIERAVERPGVLPEGIEVRYVTEALARPGHVPPGKGRAARDEWWAVPPERRWAMEVLGFGPEASADRDEVLRRFRRLVRLAHPDHGGENRGAAERIVELAEARRVLLDSGHLPATGTDEG